jgi:hypothetical protein
MRTGGSLLKNEINKTLEVLNDETVHEIGTKLEHTPWKSVKHFAEETKISKSSAQTSTKLPEQKPFKTEAVYELQPHDPSTSKFL